MLVDVPHPDTAAGPGSAFGRQPVGGAEDIDGTGQDVAVVVLLGQVGVGNEDGLLHGGPLRERSVAVIGHCGAAIGGAPFRMRPSAPVGAVRQLEHSVAACAFRFGMTRDRA
ncbi:hypothetical protein [Streptomyces fructofermentans]|uniref:Uncharacterized protein n=1 Tax=Streptomyces fructofermentans TaxID=152141 RepID=A0A918KBF2_9ACTN|nr:hypothetical protein [Streptomyces fructofermentans]GGX56429.1 hypothetical protein GCM10010515_24790 [Streptomyces fructofermentans]